MRPVWAYKYITALYRLYIYILCGMDEGWWNGRGGTVSLIYQWLCVTRQCSDSTRPPVAGANGCFAVGPISLLGFLSLSLSLSLPFSLSLSLYVPRFPYALQSEPRPSIFSDGLAVNSNKSAQVFTVCTCYPRRMWTLYKLYTKSQTQLCYHNNKTFLRYLDKGLEPSSSTVSSWTDG